MGLLQLAVMCAAASINTEGLPWGLHGKAKCNACGYECAADCVCGRCNTKVSRSVRPGEEPSY